MPYRAIKALILTTIIFLSAILIGTYWGATNYMKAERGLSFGATDAEIRASIDAVEDTYFKANGKYLQIVAGGKLPSYETGTLQSKLGYIPPDDYAVDVWEYKGERGYNIRRILPITSDFVTSTTSDEI